MTQDMLIEAIGMIDTDLLENYTYTENRLISKQKRRLPAWGKLLVAAACVILVFSLLLASLPLHYIIHRESINASISEAVDQVLFPLDQEDWDEQSQEQMLNWVDWPITEQIFSAMGAGTDQSAIEAMKDTPALQGLADFLERLYRYYLDHKEEIDEIIDEYESESEDQTQNGEVGIEKIEPAVLEYEYNEKSNSYTVTNYVSHTNSTVVIPDHYNGLPITAIGKDAFRSMSGATKVILPNTITEVGEYAFFGIQDLERISMPGVKVIGGHAFNECVSLFDVDMPMIERIEEYAFTGCKGLKSIDLGAELHYLGKYAFAQCTSLWSILIPKNVDSMGNGVFAHCTSLEIVNIEGEPLISDYMFDGCTSLFLISSSLPLEVVGAYGFRGCKSLSDIEMELRKAGDRAFYECGLFEIDLSGCKTDVIDSHLMYGSPNLKRVYISSDIKRIMSYAFYECPNLEEIVYNGTGTQWESVDVDHGAIPSGIKVICTDGEVFTK